MNKKILYWISLLLMAVLVSGCAKPINELNAQKYYNAGEEASAKGDLIHAKKMYYRSLVNARSGGMGPGAEANLYMKLGRINGNICEQDEAEKDFLAAIALYKANYASDSDFIFISTMELGQFSYDIGRYENAVIYFGQALEIGGAKYKERQPSSYYEVLADYSDALKKTNNHKAKEIEKVLASNSQFLKKKSGYKRYPKKCK